MEKKHILRIILGLAPCTIGAMITYYNYYSYNPYWWYKAYNSSFIIISIVSLALFLLRILPLWSIILTAICSMGFGVFRMYLFVTEHFLVYFPARECKNLFSVISNINYILGRLGRMDWLWFLIGLFSVAIGIFVLKNAIKVFKPSITNKILKPSDTHGSARISNKKEIKSVINEDGIPLGAMPNIRDYSNPQAVIESINKGKDNKVQKSIIA